MGSTGFSFHCLFKTPLFSSDCIKIFPGGACRRIPLEARRACGALGRGYATSKSYPYLFDRVGISMERTIKIMQRCVFSTKITVGCELTDWLSFELTSSD